MTSTRDHALELIRRGYRPLPIKLTGEKSPDLPEWRDYLDPARPYPDDLADKWFAEGKQVGLGLILGTVGNGLGVIDAEYQDFADDFLAAVHHFLPHLIGKIPTVITPGKDGEGSGRHFYFRHPKAVAAKLASLNAEEQQKRTEELITKGRWKLEYDKNGKQVMVSPCALEMRGEGTQILLPGGDRRQHPAARWSECTHPEYRYENHLRPWDAPLLSDEDFEIVVEIGKALSLVEHKEAASRFDQDADRRNKRVEGSVLPGDDFNLRGPAWPDLLTGHFDYVFTGGNGVDYYRRVGKSRGISATLGKCTSKGGMPLFYNFSTSVDVLDTNRSYDKFAVLATLLFNGDFAKCASSLAKQGYGTPKHRRQDGPALPEMPPADPTTASEEEPATVSFFDAVKEFPLDVLPSRIADYCREVAIAKDAPIDFAACMALCVASAAIGACRKVVWKNDHVEMANLYMALVGGASCGKSPTFRELLRPLMAEAQELARENQRLLDIYEMEKEESSAKVYTKPPKLKEIHVEDFTVESLIPIMAQNNRGLAIPQDELTRWLESMNQYSGKGSNTDRSFYLSAWNGQPFKKNRRTGNEQILTGDVYLTIYGGIQPSRLAAITGGNITGDGFADRFLFCFPEPRPLCPYDFEKTMSASARVAWDDVYRSLRSLEYDQATDINGNVFEVALDVHLSPAARAVFSEWDVAHIAEVNDKLVSPHLVSVWGKFRAHFPRLALILHYLRAVEQIEKDEFLISGETVQGVVKLVEYFKSHARKAYSTFPENKTDQQAFDLLHWMQRQKPERAAKGWTAKQVLRCRRVAKTSEAEKLFDELVDRGAGNFDLSGKVFFLAVDQN
jgi:hypothetical protein